MELLRTLALSSAIVLFVLPLQSQNAFTPDKIPYGPPPDSVPAGAQLAVLEGDPHHPPEILPVRLKMRLSLLRASRHPERSPRSEGSLLPFITIAGS